MKEATRLPATPNVLIIAYHFPPQTGSSGMLRALKFCRYLPELQWTPTVLTVSPCAYESVSPAGKAETPCNVRVIRAFALDSKRHLGFGGSYISWTALPDRWMSWLLSAVPLGLFAIRKRKIDVILSTFPIASAVLIGFVLHRLTGKPWIVDLRDSMTEKDYPRDVRTRRVWRWLERKAVQHAALILFTARSAQRMYLERYPGLSPAKCLVIPNGYDEEDFQFLQARNGLSAQGSSEIRLVHIGLVYPEERNPRPFLQALGRLKREGKIDETSLHVVFRAPGFEDLYRSIIHELQISDIVQLEPHLPYQRALQECQEADGLLLFQAANCDHQIPAKTYEYLRLRKPILALTSENGDTAELLRDIGGATIVDLEDDAAIYDLLPDFLAALRSGTHPLPDPEKVQLCARRNGAQVLAAALSRILSDGPAHASLDASAVPRLNRFGK